MGFLDKLQQTAKDTLEKGKEKAEEFQADRKADQLLRDLGAWYYAGRTNRAADANEHVERIVAELEAHEAEHGPLGTKEEAPDAAPLPTDAAPAAAAPEPPPAPPAPDVTPPVTPPPSAPVTSGPPPPPSG
jgi:hypothetical protein